MKILNNKGQTLVLFILLLPIFLMLMYMVVELGLNSITKRTVDSNIENAIKYGMKNLDDVDINSKIEQLIRTNIDNINSLNIEVSDEIVVEIDVSFNNIMGDMFKQSLKNYNMKYRGYKENDSIKIERGY